MKKFNCIFSVVIFVLLFLSSSALFAQDPGNKDTLWIERENGRIPPNTSVVRHVWGVS